MQNNNLIEKKQEQVEKPQNASDTIAVPDDSIAKLFAVNDILLYENILITEIGFNVRVQNCFRVNGYRTLDEILRSSRKKISKLKGLGKKSVENIFKTLEKIFSSRRKRISLKAVRRIKAELGDFLCGAILNHDPQIPSVIAAFERFSAFIAVKDIFRDLPEELRNKRARLFLRACNLDYAAFFDTLPEELTIPELPKYLYENSSSFDSNTLKEFNLALRFDVRACARKTVGSFFKDKRDFDIVCCRINGGTLKEIGKNFHVTRERVRQIEFKAVERLSRYNNFNSKRIFSFIHAFTDGKSFLTLEDMKNFMDAADAEMFWYLAVKADLQSRFFRFDKELKVFVFADESILDKNELTKNLPDVMEEETFEKAIIKLAREKKCSTELIKIKLLKIYKCDGKIFYRGRLTLTWQCSYILKERFADGYKISDKIFHSRFISCFQEIFGKKVDMTQRAVDAIVSKIGVLCDRGKYIHSDLFHLPPEVIERVKDFIENSDRTAIFYKEIFEALKDSFVGTQITNHYFLQGAIKFYELPYMLRKDYLTKSSGIDMGTEFTSFVAERGEVSSREIKENFISFIDQNINFMLLRCTEVIRVGDGIFIHASRLNLQEEDFEQIKEFLNQNCSTPVSSRILFNLFFEHFLDFMTRNKIQNHRKLFGILHYMFRDDFNFSRPYVSKTDIRSLNNKKFLLRFLENIEKIEVEKLISICVENGLRYGARTYLIELLHPDFVRVDEFNLMRPESIGVTDEIIAAVVEIIQSAIEQNGGWKAAQTFEDYEGLPPLKIPWNSFLLESVVSLADDTICSLKTPSTSVDFSSTVFLSEEFSDDDLQSFVIKILTAEHRKKPFHSEDEIFNWLREQGLCNKKLPKFLEGRAFELLSE